MVLVVSPSEIVTKKLVIGELPNDLKKSMSELPLELEDDKESSEELDDDWAWAGVAVAVISAAVTRPKAISR